MSINDLKRKSTQEFCCKHTVPESVVFSANGFCRVTAASGRGFLFVKSSASALLLVAVCGPRFNDFWGVSVGSNGAAALTAC